MSAGLERDRMCQEGLGPRLIRLAGRLGLMSRGHAEQIADPHRLEVVALLRRSVISEELQHFVVQTKLSFRDGQADSRGSKALAQ